MAFIDLAKTRRSIRGFQADIPVTQEQIDKILEAAQAAPSGGNRQPWHFYVIRRKEMILDIKEKACDQTSYASAPLVIAVCIDATRFSERYGERGQSLYAIQDTAAAIQNMLLCAAELGLGTCWCGAFDENAVRELLSLPETKRPVALIPVGAPAMEPVEFRRRPVADITTFID